MDRSIRPVDAVYGAAVGAETRQRVMRNTYALLALSMLPTVAGAWLGMAMGFTFFAGKPLVGFMVFMAVAFGFMFAIEKFKNCLLYTSPSPRDRQKSRMPSSA